MENENIINPNLPVTEDMLNYAQPDINPQFVDDDLANLDNGDFLPQENQGNITDSDIEDPKYIPTGNILNNAPSNNMIFDNNDNIVPSTQNEMLLQTQILNLENDTQLANRTLKELENENNQLKNELIKNQEQFESKEGMNIEFKNLFSLFKQRFAAFEKRNNYLHNYIKDLENQLKSKELEIQKSNKINSQTEVAKENASLYEQHINELQDDLKEKFKKLDKKFIDKEKKIKEELISELNSKSKKLDDLKVENEKLKCDISNHKMEIENLHSQLSEKDYMKNSAISQFDKDIEDLREKVSEKENELQHIDDDFKYKIDQYESEMNELKDENNNLINEVNDLRNNKNQRDIEVINYKHNVEMLTNELNQNKISIENKNTIIEQLNFQIDEMKHEIEGRDDDVQKYEADKQNELQDYHNQIDQLIQEKNVLEAQNVELTENLGIANENLKQFNDLITEKYSNIEQEYNNQMAINSNIDKKYKNILKKMKNKQTELSKENNQLKEIINNQEIANQNQLNQTMFNIKPNLGLNSAIADNNPLKNDYSLNFGNNNILRGANINNSFNMNNSIQGLFPTIRKFDEGNENGQLKTLEEFKNLLKKMDEKLEAPLVNNNGSI